MGAVGSREFAIEPPFTFGSGLKRNDDRGHGPSLRLLREAKDTLSFLAGPVEHNEADQDADRNGSTYPEANQPAKGGGLGKRSHTSLQRRLGSHPTLTWHDDHWLVFRSDCCSAHLRSISGSNFAR